MDFEKLAQAMGDLNEPVIMALVQEIIDSGGDDVYRALEAFQAGLGIISDRFNNCEYFVGDLMFAGQLMTLTVNILRPALRGNQFDKTDARRVILCTVEGDLHDIGKNIVSAVLEGQGINVIDLGVNVSASAVVERAIAENVKVIALSGVLSFARDSMKMTVEAFVEAGMRDQVKIIVGGSCVDESSYKETGADAWAAEPQESAEICGRWLS